MIDSDEEAKLYGVGRIKIREDDVKEIYCLMRDALSYLEDEVIGNEFIEQFARAKNGLEFDLGANGNDTDKIYNDYQIRCIKIAHSGGDG